MCLIVDANVASLVLAARPHADFEPVTTALFNRRAVAVYGGQLRREYERVTHVLRILVILDRQGSARAVPDLDVDKMTEQVVQEGACQSDDPHIIALARVSDVRLLCSRDRDLHQDFKDPKVLQPRGSVYQNRSHRHLIRKHCG
jgi:hypothetical protein